MSVTRIKFGKISPLLEDEKILHEQKRFRLITSKCLPTYRICFNLPFFLAIRLLVTNRRCLVITRMFRFMIQEISTWYPGKNPGNDLETVTSIRCDKGFFGKFLEIRSRDPKRSGRWWYWNPKLTLRFYFKNPEKVEKMILHAMVE